MKGLQKKSGQDSIFGVLWHLFHLRVHYSIRRSISGVDDNRPLSMTVNDVHAKKSEC